MSKFVRLKPFNGKQHKLRRFTVFGIKFEESKGWYEVQDDVAAYCKTVKQVHDTPDADFSAFAFDVVDTVEEARTIDESERKKAERKLADDAQKVTKAQNMTHRSRAGRSAQGDLTTADLNEPITKGPSFDEMDDTFPEGDLNPANAKAPAKTVESDSEGDGAVPPVLETTSSTSKPRSSKKTQA